MSRHHALITPEELQCLLGVTPERSHAPGTHLVQNQQTLYFGSVLWLVKGVFLYAVLTSPAAALWMDGSRYLWVRGIFELVCLAVFWAAAVHPRGRTVALASMLVASTALLMDAISWLALTH